MLSLLWLGVELGEDFLVISFFDTVLLLSWQLE